MYRNTLVNLAEPFFGFSYPCPAKTQKVILKLKNYISVVVYLSFQYLNTSFTIWDKFNVSSDLTLLQLIELFRQQHGLIVKQLFYDGAETIALYYEGLETEYIK
jgi:hypothetical protein